MSKTHYVAVYTDSDCMIGCAHKHKTVTAAAACISHAGGYVVALTRKKYRELSDEEEAEFQKAMYGREGFIRRDALYFAFIRVKISGIP